MFYISVLDPITFWDLLLGRFGDIKGIKISPNKPVNNTSIGNAGRRTIKSGGFWLSNGRIIEQLINGKLLPEYIEIVWYLILWKSTKMALKVKYLYLPFSQQPWHRWWIYRQPRIGRVALCNTDVHTLVLEEYLGSNHPPS